MKTRSLLLLLASIFLVAGCDSNPTTSDKEKEETHTSESGSHTGGSGTHSGGTGTGGKTEEEQTGPIKTTVAAHTLSDSYPSGFNPNSNGQQVKESTWNAIRYASDETLSKYFNYTYTSISGYTRTIQKFTKNGYSTESIYGKVYYEQSKTKCYSYAEVSDGVLRSETVFDIESRAKSTLESEIRVHMFDMSCYEYYYEDGCYWYFESSFAAAVKFQNGYLTYLHYSLGGTAIFDIEAVFDTTIEIPESYYYK